MDIAKHEIVTETRDRNIICILKRLLITAKVARFDRDQSETN